MECQKMRSYLVETESTVEAEWIGKTFLDKGAYIFHLVFLKKYLIYIYFDLLPYTLH